MNKQAKILIGAVIAVVVIAGGGVAYFLSGDAEETPTVDTGGTLSKETEEAKSATDVVVDGTWTLNPDSFVQYRVEELLSGLATTATGKTNAVTGSMTIEGTSITEAFFEVDVATFTSDKSQRDGQFSGRIMETSKFPTATFTLTSPIDLGTVPADGAEIAVTASGDLTLKDTTKPIELELTAKREGAIVTVAGSYTVVFADWNIANPSIGFVETEDQGALEVKLLFQKD